MTQRSVCVFTVKHTGTHFTMRHLQRMGLQQAFVHPYGNGFESVPTTDYFYHLHVEERSHFFKNVSEHDIKVTTLRDPRKVFYSLGQRGSHDAYHAEQAVLFAFAQWKQRVEQFNPFILQVDADWMVDAVCDLAHLVGVDNYEYAEVNRNSRKACDFPYSVPSSITELASSLGYPI